MKMNKVASWVHYRLYIYRTAVRYVWRCDMTTRLLYPYVSELENCRRVCKLW